MIRFLKQPNMTRSLAEAGRKWVHENFSAEEMVTRKEKLYYEVMAKHHGRNSQTGDWR